MIPWLGSAFRGFIIGFWHAGRLYRFATYTGARVEKLAIDEHSVHWVVRDRQYRLEMVAARTQAGLLRGPQAMDMGGRVPETLQATVTVRLSALAGGVEHLVANFFPQADLDDLEIQAGLREFSVPVSLVDQVRIAGRSAYGRAAAVHVPLLIVQGAQDEVVKPAYTRRLARRFPHTPRYLEVNAGHDPIKPVHADWPTVEQAVLEFAASLQPPPSPSIGRAAGGEGQPPSPSQEPVLSKAKEEGRGEGKKLIYCNAPPSPNPSLGGRGKRVPPR